MHLFYTPDIDGDLYTLEEQESKHCIRVLRLGVGEEIRLIDGKGGWYLARIIQPDAKRCGVEIIEKTLGYGARDFRLHIAMAPTKNIDRFEWFLEKATEIGIDEITPLLCEHSERKEVKAERLEKVIVAAMKQSYKAYLPKLNPMIRFKDFINGLDNEQCFIAHCHESEKFPLKDCIRDKKAIVVCVGPEGDFSPEEVALAVKSGAMPVSLGSARLRTETAGVVACHTVNLIKD
ncbi:MAG: 16S rRNA (uracil(1498)-N(3))-methyltransferase [Bacteroidota bacterium]|nr:16S rRNA (uracil(1498)-N(3))-methyltransferase [Bacteroidota bacterium]